MPTRTQPKLVIDINGRDGTLYSLLGHVRTLGTKRGFDPARISEIRDEICRASFESAVTVFQREFGDMVEIVRTDEPVDKCEDCDCE